MLIHHTSSIPPPKVQEYSLSALSMRGLSNFFTPFVYSLLCSVVSLLADYLLPLEMLEPFFSSVKYTYVRLYFLPAEHLPTVLKCTSLLSLLLVDTKISQKSDWMQLTRLKKLRRIEIVHHGAHPFQDVANYFSGLPLTVTVRPAYSFE
jgi:hypothetical protein